MNGCITLYQPNAINSPLLSEEGEGNIGGSIGFSGSGLYNIQGSYAVAPNTGIMLNGMYKHRDRDLQPGTEKLRIGMVETGIGYFKPFGSKSNGLFQFYGGAGMGQSQDRYTGQSEPAPEVRSSYYNVFLQPGIALKNENFQLSFDLRANYVKLYDIKAYLYEKFEWWNTDFNYKQDTTIDFINLESAITMRTGGEKLKAMFQLGFILPVVNPESYFAVNNSSLLILPLFKISAGINYTFGRKLTQQQ